MLPLAHLGIGYQLGARIRHAQPQALLLGALLPDLIDKTLYYVPSLLTGRHGTELGLFCGTRSIGHSMLFLAALLAMTALPGGRRRWWLGLAVGVATHLLLDNFAEPFQPLSEHSSRIALLFSLYGLRFPVAHHLSFAEHLALHLGWIDLVAEALGALLLAGMWWRQWERRGRVLRS